MNKNKKLIFVYNADSSIFNQVGDLIHKTVSPQTYQCRLCGLTYLGVHMKNEWKRFVESLPIKSEFYHHDEFIKQYPQFADSLLPAVFIKTNQGIRPLILASEINEQHMLKGLEFLVRRNLKMSS